VAELVLNVPLRCNFARVHAQMVESAQKFKITSEDANNAFCLSLIIDINRKLVVGLTYSSDQNDVVRPLNRHPVTLQRICMRLDGRLNAAHYG